MAGHRECAMRGLPGLTPIVLALMVEWQAKCAVLAGLQVGNEGDRSLAKVATKVEEQ